jgi:hypothetical protein
LDHGLIPIYASFAAILTIAARQSRRTKFVTLAIAVALIEPDKQEPETLDAAIASEPAIGMLHRMGNDISIERTRKLIEAMELLV